MNSILVSVIVPIYNVENYLEKCILSIINQTYKNIEIILVDDGSLDSCGLICDKYLEIDNRIKVIHKKNGGLSDARNAGIKIAKGQYFAFVDSDDYIHEEMIQVLLEKICQNNAQVSICNFQPVYENQEEVKGQLEIKKTTLFEKHEDILEYLYGEQNLIFTVAWNKLYDRELFNEIKYPIGKVHEDEFTTYKLLYKAKKIIYVDCKLYFYLQRENSITGNGFNKKSLLKLQAFEEKLIFYDKHNEQKFYNTVLKLYKIVLVEFYKRILEADSMEIQVLTPYLSSCKRRLKKGLKYMNFGWKEKLGYIMFCYNFSLYMEIQRKKEKRTCNAK